MRNSTEQCAPRFPEKEKQDRENNIEIAYLYGICKRHHSALNIFAKHLCPLPRNYSTSPVTSDESMHRRIVTSMKSKETLYVLYHIALHRTHFFWCLKLLALQQGLKLISSAWILTKYINKIKTNILKYQTNYNDSLFPFGKAFRIFCCFFFQSQEIETLAKMETYYYQK